MRRYASCGHAGGLSCLNNDCSWKVLRRLFSLWISYVVCTPVMLITLRRAKLLMLCVRGLYCHKPRKCGLSNNMKSPDCCGIIVSSHFGTKCDQRTLVNRRQYYHHPVYSCVLYHGRDSTSLPTPIPKDAGR